VIRPTGLLDPEIEVRPVGNQVEDLLGEIRDRIAGGERVLVTTLTKRMAEDLTEYYQDLGIAARYLHSDIDTLERVEVIGELRRGGFDVLVGINLLREGLDLPEVSLVGILDADKEGFLRSHRSLIQTIGRASRNIKGKVVMYGDRMTDSMRQALDETERRRTLQAAYNLEHGIVPKSVERAILDFQSTLVETDGGFASSPAVEDLPQVIGELTAQMQEAAAALDFERAAELRDQIRSLSERELRLREPGSNRSGRRAKGSGTSGKRGRLRGGRGKRRVRA